MESGDDRHSSLIAFQRWKLWLLGTMAAFAAFLLFWSDQFASFLNTPIAPSLVTLSGTVLAAITLVAGVLSLRCPSCRLSLLWYGVSKKSIGSWLGWVLDIERCPRCGFVHSNTQPDQSG